MIRTAVIGIGNQGRKYASILQEGQVPDMELTAVTRLKEPERELLRPSLERGLPVCESADALLQAVETGKLSLDAVIVSTPHYSHEEITVRALENGLHVLCDKPAGVYSRQARQMEEAANRAGRVFSMVFHQRTLAVYRRMREIVAGGRYGAMKRMAWTVTDWYRPNRYYQSGGWRATWKGDGGGVLLNQCAHNLDLLQWILGMPVKVRAFCGEGRYHPIEVEDEVTAYLEWPGGATGTFITSTGEAPGVNRFEIFLEEACLVCENGVLRVGETAGELGCPEPEYRRSSEDFFRKIHGTWHEERPESADTPLPKVLSGFADEILGRGKSVADGREGRKSLLISNAVYLSSWEGRTVDIPAIGSPEEQAFEAAFEARLAEKIRK